MSSNENNNTMISDKTKLCVFSKKLFRKIRITVLQAVIVTAFAGTLSVTSCNDNVDPSNLYSFHGELITSYLNSRTDLSDFSYLCSRVKLSPKSKSTILDLLSARGHYTCFAPTNDAIHTFVDSIMHEPGYDLTLLSDSLTKMIVHNCLVDCGNDKAFMSTDFAEGVLGRRNLDDRYVTINHRYNENTQRSEIVLNNTAVITEQDIEAENGYVHILNAVPSLSMSTLPDLMRTIPNIRIFSRLLKETGWDKKMTAYQDDEYEYNHPETGRPSHPESEPQWPCPPHRRYGFTAFPETDDTYITEWGCPEPTVDNMGDIENWDEIFSVIQAKCKQIGPYNTYNADDITDEDNCVNQFVAYHILPMTMAYNNMVIHYSEYGYGYGNPTRLTINCNEFYTVIGKHRRLLKMTEGPTTEGIRINRHYDIDADTGDETTVYKPGIEVQPFNTAGDSYALNGFYYPIDHILVYDTYTRDNTLNDRLRFETASMYPELITAGLRRPYRAIAYNLPKNFLADIIRTDETEMIYKTSFGNSWYDYHGDEFQMLGQYDFVFSLPPVPFDGTYELRIGLSNTGSRGMAQFYFGTDPQNLAAIGLPIDMRMSGDDPNIGWIKDDPDNPEANAFNDKTLRNHGYMKAPKSCCFPNSVAAYTSLRDLGGGSLAKLRRILLNTTFKTEQKYYCRFKSLLANPDSQFFFDYIELVPKSVYNNASKPEDIW